MRIVMKFGGSSLADTPKICGAARKIEALYRRGHELVVVVSAQGDTTDDMIQRAAQLHLQPSAREMDAFLSAGEQMSAALMAMALDKMGIPAVSLTGIQAGVVTDGVYGNARVLDLSGHRIEEELQKGKVVVVAGFQGVGSNGDITTLGRGGSDTTAVALAAFLKAAQCRIYTDVDGVYDKDPRKFPDAVKYPRISWDAMLAMAQEGAQVLHDRCVAMAKEYGVTIEVLSSFRDVSGTLVGPMK